jgi:hypothetical protein
VVVGEGNNKPNKPAFTCNGGERELSTLHYTTQILPTRCFRKKDLVKAIRVPTNLARLLMFLSVNPIDDIYENELASISKRMRKP